MGWCASPPLRPNVPTCDPPWIAATRMMAEEALPARDAPPCPMSGRSTGVPRGASPAAAAPA
eukprot:1240609-Alexandrium_andersonii.AAC.1